MDVGEVSIQVPECPEASDKLEAQIRQAVDELICFVRSDSGTLRLMDFERSLWSHMAVLFRLCVAMFLALRHERLNLSDYEADGWRVKKEFATRTVKTICGAVTYGRAYLRRNGNGWFPLDADLGITADGFSWRVIDLVTRLATRVSYKATQSIMRAMLGWSPSTKAIESLVIGLGRRAPAFMATQQSFDDDGEVLVIEVDGKAAPMATEAELEARRRKRKHGRKCGCGCQRHRGRKRRKGKTKKRKKRGHNSKNGRSATLVAMYTLRRGKDGKLHGPINKKIFGQFGPRKDAIAWARDQAARPGATLEDGPVVPRRRQPGTKAVGCTVQSTVARWPSRLASETSEEDLQVDPAARSEHKEETRDADRADQVLRGTYGDDALRRIPPPGSGSGHRRDRRRLPLRNRRAIGLLGHALEARRSGTVAATSVHRIERRLGPIHRLGSRPNDRGTEEWQTHQNPTSQTKAQIKNEKASRVTEPRRNAPIVNSRRNPTIFRNLQTHLLD